MFRHSESHCPFDLWAPGERNKIENVAFSAYAKHEQEKEDVIQMILTAIESGDTEMSIQLDDCFSESDVEYIKEEVYRRMR